MLHSADPGGEDKIRNGELVVVYERFDSLKAVRVNSRTEFSNRFGHFKMQVGLQILCLSLLMSKRTPMELLQNRSRRVLLPGLDRPAFRQPRVCQASQLRLGVFAEAHARAMDKGAAAPYPDTVCSRYQPDLQLS